MNYIIHLATFLTYLATKKIANLYCNLGKKIFPPFLMFLDKIFKYNILYNKKLY